MELITLPSSTVYWQEVTDTCMQWDRHQLGCQTINLIIPFDKHSVYPMSDVRPDQTSSSIMGQYVKTERIEEKM